MAVKTGALIYNTLTTEMRAVATGSPTTVISISYKYHIRLRSNNYEKG